MRRSPHRARGLDGAIADCSPLPREAPTTLVVRIANIARTLRVGIAVTLVNEPVAIFGPPSNAREKFVALATVLAGVSLTGITAIDLRAPSNPVLTP